jgi:hypothetical protein
MQRVEDNEEITERVAAIDVGKAEVVVCIRVPDPARPGRRRQEIVHSSTLTPRLLKLADRLCELGVTRSSATGPGSGRTRAGSSRPPEVEAAGNTGHGAAR